MKKITVMLLPLVIAALCSFNMKIEGDNSPVVKENRKLGTFQNVSADANCDVIIIQGDKSSIIVEGNKKSVGNTVTSIENGTLKIAHANNNNIIFGNVKVTVTTPEVNSVSLYGTGDIHIPGKLVSETLRIHLCGTGDILANALACINLDAILDGTGDMKINNVSCSKSTITLNGTGDISTKTINVEESFLTLTGTGDMDVKFVDCGSASCSLSGIGDIELEGNLKSLKKDDSGIGSIETKKLHVGM